jgi:hypothetical protein
MKKSDRVVGQLSSGRWILTIIAGGCLLLLTFTDCKSVLQGKPPPISVEAIFSIITMVFVSYFNKPKENGDSQDNGNDNPPVPPPIK